MFASKDIFLKSSGGYQISRSVRTRSSASAYFNRTFSTPTLSTKWTWSGWVKRGTLGAAQTLFSGQVDVNNWGIIAFLAGDTLSFQQADAGSVTSTVTTTQVFRDPSAWYHIVVAFDSTQATAANRLIMYVNGVQITAFGTATYLAQNTASRINAAVAHQISRYISAAQYFDGYLAEVNFIDGQALTPSSFGQNDPVTGVWQPKKYSGTYGTNGFYLNFSDNSAATAAAIGKDYSGNGNNWTPNNISVTAGVTYDSMLDTPTPYADGGNGRGNYAVLNPVDLGYIATLSEANLKVSTASAGNAASASTMALTTNTYWEVTIGSNTQVGLIWGRASDAFGASSLSMFASGASGSLVNATRTLSATPSWSNGDTLGFAWNNSTRVLTLYQAGSATAVMTMTTPSTGDPQVAITNYTSGAVMSSQANFGQRPFTYTPPSGFVALNTQNLPTPTITNGATVMAASTYTGTGATQSIVNSGNNTGAISFKPDFVWAKSRSSAESNRLYDSVRGATKTLYSNLTNAETTEAQSLTSFDANGFSLGTGAPNTSAVTYVAWQWQAGQGSTSSNTSGSITSTVSVNATAGFSVVTYTGTGANATVGHGLGVAPSMIIVKNRSSGTTDWAVYHKNLTSAAYYLWLNSTQAQATSAIVWNSTTPTSSVFSIGTGSQTNGSTNSMVAYCFAAVAGYAAFGSYTGNASTDGPFVYLGFRPRWVMFKRTDSADDWIVFDTSRNTYDVMNSTLFPNGNYSETTDSNRMIDSLSNGFKVRSSPVYINASGGTYIYAAFAENPFKLSLAR